MNIIVGVSGVAGSGKDTFFQLLSERIPCRRYSLADGIKNEVNQWSKFHYNIDSLNCTREQKEIIRPFWVYHGTYKRNNTKGRYWIEKLNDFLIKDKFSGLKVITDIRYDEYDNDEVFWLKNELNGILVHISQFEWQKDLEEGALVKKIREPINSEEEKNNPKLKIKSDFQIEWEFLKNSQIKELSPHIDNFLEWLQKNTNERRLLATTL